MDYITGVSGFVGSHLLNALDTNVFSIPHAQIATTTLKRFDRFYFLSTYGNMYGQNDDDLIFQANITDLVHILAESRRFKFKSFVYLSSSSVKLRMQTMYSRCKRAAEEILLSYMEKYQQPVCIIRPFSITGVGEQSQHLIPTLIRSCLTGEKVPFIPTPVHDYIDVADVIAGILNLSGNSIKGIFELGTGKKHTNQEVLDLVCNITKKKANIQVVQSLRPYDNQDWYSVNFRVRSWGWLPKKTLEQSITEMVQAYEK